MEALIIKTSIPITIKPYHFGFFNSLSPLRYSSNLAPKDQFTKICYLIDSTLCLHLSTIYLTKQYDKPTFVFIETQRNYWKTGLKVLMAVAICLLAYYKIRFRLPIAILSLLGVSAKVYSRWNLPSETVYEGNKPSESFENVCLGLIKDHWGEQKRDSEPPSVDRFIYDVYLMANLAKEFNFVIPKETEEEGIQKINQEFAKLDSIILSVYRKIADKFISAPYKNVDENASLVEAMTRWNRFSNARAVIEYFTEYLGIELPVIQNHRGINAFFKNQLGVKKSKAELNSSQQALANFVAAISKFVEPKSKQLDIYYKSKVLEAFKVFLEQIGNNMSSFIKALQDENKGVNSLHASLFLVLIIEMWFSNSKFLKNPNSVREIPSLGEADTNKKGDTNEVSLDNLKVCISDLIEVGLKLEKKLFPLLFS